MTLTVGSVCSGIGGIDLGLERSGMKTVWQVEIKPFQHLLLNIRFPNAKQYRDITKLDTAIMENVDLLCGGIPCQPFSLAGRRLGLNDPRYLWPYFLELIRDFRPRWVMVENVPGILSSGALEIILSDLAELRYDAEWASIPAFTFGFPHRRNRFFLIAYPNVQGLEGSIKPRIFNTKFNQVAVRWRRLSKSDTVRRTYGIPNYMDRIIGLGNAVVSDITEEIGKRIIIADEV